MRYLSVIRQKSLTERNETDTCPLTDSRRVHVIDPTISFLSDFLTDSLPSIWRTHVIAALVNMHLELHIFHAEFWEEAVLRSVL